MPAFGPKAAKHFGSVAPRNGRGTSIRVRRRALGDQVNRRSLSDDMGRLHEAEYSTLRRAAFVQFRLSEAAM